MAKTKRKLTQLQLPPPLRQKLDNGNDGRPATTNHGEVVECSLSLKTAQWYADNILEGLLSLKDFIDDMVKNSDEIIGVLQTELAAAKKKINILEPAANKWKNAIEKLKVENENYKKALKLAKLAELQVTQAALAAGKERKNELEAAAKEWKNTIEKRRAESEAYKKALALAKEGLRVKKGELVGAVEKINALEAAAIKLNDTTESLRLESKNDKKALKMVMAELQIARTELAAATDKNNNLEDAAKIWKKIVKRLRAENKSDKKAQKLVKAEREVLRTLVASSSAATILPESNPVRSLVVSQHLNASRNETAGVDNLEEMRKIRRIFETYFSCVQENRQLEMEVGNQRIKLEGCQDHQKKLTDENMELKRKLYEVERNQHMLRKQLEEKTNDMQHMESLNQILVVRDCLNNCELQEAHIELKNGLQDVLSHHSVIGIKRMGELNLKPFRDVCMQKFLSEDWDTKSAELCSLWQENIKNQQWFPFKRILINGKLDEVVDDYDDKLKQLKDVWGEQVYKAVCGALSEINEYNPNTRCAVPEIWNFKHDRRARLKEVIEYLLKKLKVMINPRMLPQLTTGLEKASPLDSGGIRN